MDIKRAGGLPTTAIGDASHIPQLLFGPDGTVISATSVAASVPATPPTGTTMVWPTATAPAWAVLCDGASYLRAGAMANLFAVIGTTYGAADGTHFNVPDLRDRVPEHASTRALAATSGGTTHQHGPGTLVIPNHTHGLSAGYAEIGIAAGVGIVQNRITVTAYTDTHVGTSTVTAESVSRTAGTNLGGTTDAVPSATGVTGNTANATGPIDPRLAMTWIIAI